MLAAEVEVVQPVGRSLLAGGDLVEFVLHGGGEVVVDQAPKCCSSRPMTANATQDGTIALPFLYT